VTAFQIAGEELAVVSFPVDVTSPAAHLTASEWEIVDMIREGRSNREIAQFRGTSSRTVANQIAGLFKKLGVSSRSALVSALYRPTA
jgi:DNA-binding NarL/FixJ family response regulator